MLFPEAAKCAQKGTTRNRNQVSQPALIGQSQAGFVLRRRGPPRFTPPVCFPSPEQHEFFLCFSSRSLLGFAALDTTKKVTEGCRVQDYDLLICTRLNSSPTASGQGIIVKNTEQFRGSKVFLNCIRIAEQHIYTDCSNIRQPGAAGALAVKETFSAAGWRSAII